MSFADVPTLIRPFLPSPQLVAAGTPLVIAYTFLAVAFVSRLHKNRGVPTPYTRKIFHFSIFTMAGVIQLSWGLPGVVIFGFVVTVAVGWALYRGETFPFYEALARPSDRPRRTLFIVIPLVTTVLGGVSANLLFPRFAYVGYLVCGWGDALGEPVGTRWGAHRYQVPSLAGVSASRSIEGSSAVFLAGSLAAFIGLSLAGYSHATAAYVALATGLVGALVEAFSTHGLDNFTVQLAAAMATLLV